MDAAFFFFFFFFEARFQRGSSRRLGPPVLKRPPCPSPHPRPHRFPLPAARCPLPAAAAIKSSFCRRVPIAAPVVLQIVVCGPIAARCSLAAARHTRRCCPSYSFVRVCSEHVCASVSCPPRSLSLEVAATTRGPGGRVTSFMAATISTA